MLSKSFSNAFTLIELLATLTVLVISLFFLSPVIFKLNDHLALNSEVENLRAFVYQVQTQARLTKTHYALIISEDKSQQKWCIAGIQTDGKENKKYSCDCLNKKSCSKYKNIFYYESDTLKTNIAKSQMYPAPFTHIDGISGRLSSQCIRLTKNSLSTIFRTNDIGGFYVKSKEKRSDCG